MSLEEYLHSTSINGVGWDIYLKQDPQKQGSYWYGDSKLRKITIVNVVRDEGDFYKYLIWRFTEAAKMQYTKN